MKIRPVGAEFFHVDRRTDRHTDGWTDMNPIVAFGHFANAPKIPVSLCIYEMCHFLFEFNQKFQCIEKNVSELIYCLYKDKPDEHQVPCRVEDKPKHTLRTLVDFQLDAQNSYLFIYLHIIHLLKSSTCFERYPAHLQEVYVVTVYMQLLVPSLSAGDCPVHRLRKKHVEDFNKCIVHK